MAEIDHAPFSLAGLRYVLEVQRAQHACDQELIRRSKEAIAHSRRILDELLPIPEEKHRLNKARFGPR